MTQSNTKNLNNGNGIKGRTDYSAHNIVLNKFVNSAPPMAVGGGQVNWEMIEFFNTCEDQDINLSGWKLIGLKNCNNTPVYSCGPRCTENELGTQCTGGMDEMNENECNTYPAEECQMAGGDCYTIEADSWCFDAYETPCMDLPVGFPDPATGVCGNTNGMDINEEHICAFEQVRCGSCEDQIMYTFEENDRFLGGNYIILARTDRTFYKLCDADEWWLNDGYGMCFDGTLCHPDLWYVDDPSNPGQEGAVPEGGWPHQQGTAATEYGLHNHYGLNEDGDPMCNETNDWCYDGPFEFPINHRLQPGFEDDGIGSSSDCLGQFDNQAAMFCETQRTECRELSYECFEECGEDCGTFWGIPQGCKKCVPGWGVEIPDCDVDISDDCYASTFYSALHLPSSWPNYADGGPANYLPSSVGGDGQGSYWPYWTNSCTSCWGCASEDENGLPIDPECMIAGEPNTVKQNCCCKYFNCTTEWEDCIRPILDSWYESYHGGIRNGDPCNPTSFHDDSCHPLINETTLDCCIPGIYKHTQGYNQWGNPNYSKCCYSDGSCETYLQSEQVCMGCKTGDTNSYCDDPDNDACSPMNEYCDSQQYGEAGRPPCFCADDWGADAGDVISDECLDPGPDPSYDCLGVWEFDDYCIPPVSVALEDAPWNLSLTAGGNISSFGNCAEWQITDINLEVDCDGSDELEDCDPIAGGSVIPLATDLTNVYNKFFENLNEEEGQQNLWKWDSGFTLYHHVGDQSCGEYLRLVTPDWQPSDAPDDLTNVAAFVDHNLWGPSRTCGISYPSSEYRCDDPETEEFYAQAFQDKQFRASGYPHGLELNACAMEACGWGTFDCAGNSPEECGPEEVCQECGSPNGCFGWSYTGQNILNAPAGCPDDCDWENFDAPHPHNWHSLGYSTSEWMGDNEFSLVPRVEAITWEHKYKLAGDNSFGPRTCGEVEIECPEEFINVEEECFSESDLDILQFWVDANESLEASTYEELKNLPGLNWVNGYLETMDFSDSELTSSILVETGQLTELRKLFLNNNQLTGSIPDELLLLSNLNQLKLDNNNLTGQIPSEIGSLTNLIVLYLDNNNLTGEIPESIGQLVNLDQLKLHKNKLGCYEYDYENNYCPITCVDETISYLGSTMCNSLEVINASPESWGSPGYMQSYTTCTAECSSHIPDGLENLSLNKLMLYDNYFTSLPLNFCGAIYSSLDLDGADRFNIKTNKMCFSDNGDIIGGGSECLNILEDDSDSIGAPPAYILPIGGNARGQCCPHYGEWLDNDGGYCYDKSDLIVLKEFIKLNGHEFDDSLKPLEIAPPDNWEYGKLAKLWVSNMNLDHLPDGCKDSADNCSPYVSFDYNILKYNETSTIDAFSNIRELHLDYNNFSGEIPDAIFGLDKLVNGNAAFNELYLNQNNWSGYIPDGEYPFVNNICDLNVQFANIAKFRIDNNNLCPSYPDCLSGGSIGYQDTTNCGLCEQLPGGEDVSIDGVCYNKHDIQFLEEIIYNSQFQEFETPESCPLCDPHSFAPPSGMSPLDLGVQEWIELNESHRLIYFCSTVNDNAVCFDDNTDYCICGQDYRLGGPIPDVLGINMPQLQYLNLTSNFFTSFPESFYGLWDLEELHLGQNELIGNIPVDISDLQKLEKLSLHKNNLDGWIPEELANLINIDSLHLHNNLLTGRIPGNICGLSINWSFGTAWSIDNNKLCGPPWPWCLTITLDDDQLAYGCTHPNACNYSLDAITDDGSCLFDDDCYVCGGNNHDEDCIGNPPTNLDCTLMDCNGFCNGDAVVDCAGVCNGSTTEDCAGECNGDAVEDCAGVCGGDDYGNGICVDTPANDNQLDCNLFPNPGSCGAGGSFCEWIPYCDCENNIEDCYGNCGGWAVEDECGVCQGDGSSCS